jgi:hypothetical protein
MRVQQLPCDCEVTRTRMKAKDGEAEKWKKSGYLKHHKVATHFDSRDKKKKNNPKQSNSWIFYCFHIHPQMIQLINH